MVEKITSNTNIIVHNDIKTPLHEYTKLSIHVRDVWQKLVICIQCELPIFLALRGFALKIIYSN